MGNPAVDLMQRATRLVPEGRVVIVGLGRTGLSCARFLRARGHAVEVVDTRDDPPALGTLRAELPDVPVHLGRLDAQVLDGAAQIVLSPGVPLVHPAVAAARARGVPVHGDIELFARLVRGPVAAVTGSNGKSTVTTLLGEMARCAGRHPAVGGNLMPPALDLLDDPAADLYVLELSSFQLETTESLAPVVAAVLNLSPDHLDRYPDVDAYARAKARIFRHAARAVINLDDAVVRAMVPAGVPGIGFTLSVPGPGEFGVARRHGEDWLAHGATLLIPTREIGMAGRHNVANALAALAMGDALGLGIGGMLAALRDFRGLPHRCEPVATRDGVEWFNDSKGTNVGATLAAIEGLGAGAPLVLIAGGLGKGADFSPLAPAVRAHVRAAILLGRDAARIAAAIGDATAVEMATDLDDAVRRARAVAHAGDRVLFSPACASFDMFASYEARGDAFRATVREVLGR